MASQPWTLLSDVRWLWLRFMDVIIRRWETDNRRHGVPMPAVIIRREVAPLARHGCYYQTLSQMRVTKYQSPRRPVASSRIPPALLSVAAHLVESAHPAQVNVQMCNAR